MRGSPPIIEIGLMQVYLSCLHDKHVLLKDDLRVCFFGEMDLEESVRMNLDGCEWMDMCVPLGGWRGQSE